MRRETFAALSASAAILAAGAMIAAAIALTNRWTIVETQSGIMSMIRLDRWTGALTICALDAGPSQAPPSRAPG
jgi:hypothetical protein